MYMCCGYGPASSVSCLNKTTGFPVVAAMLQLLRLGLIVWHMYIFSARHNWMSTSCTLGTGVAGCHWVCCAPCINKVKQDKTLCSLVGTIRRLHNDAMMNRVTLELGTLKLISGCDKQLFCIVLLILWICDRIWEKGPYHTYSDFHYKMLI